MVSTHLKNISQIGSFPQAGVTILKPPPRRHNFTIHFFPNRRDLSQLLKFVETSQAVAKRHGHTPSKPNIEPEHGQLEDEISVGKLSFSGSMLFFF